MSIFVEALRSGLERETELTVSEWADRHRVLSWASAEPGRWRTSRTPYLREIMDAMSPNSGVSKVVFMKGAQVGATEAVNNCVAFWIAHAPAPILFVQPTVELATRLSKQRIAPMIESSPVLRGLVQPSRARDSGNTLLSKQFPGGILIITGANSSVGLRQMPARYVALDEVDGYVSDVGGEGDPVELAQARQATFTRNRRTILTSTPTLYGLSRIEEAYEETDKRRLFVPCPRCGNFAPIEWRNIRWAEDTPSTAHLICEQCDAEIPESAKQTMLPAGEWRPTWRADIEENRPAHPRPVREPPADVRGYHLSSLYSPLGWQSWEDCVQKFLAAKQAGPEHLKTWTNVVLGETWEERGVKIEASMVSARCEVYEAEVPADVLLIVAGADVQDDRIEMEMVGYGDGASETWGIEYRILWGNTSQPEVWQQLRDVLRTSTYEHQSGARMPISACGVDSGFRTSEVYEFCRRGAVCPTFALKGRDGPLPIVGVRAMTKEAQRRPVPVFTVGVDRCKEILYERLAVAEPGPGFCHFPTGNGYDEEFFTQLTSEKCVTRYARGHPKKIWLLPDGARNEALDCRNYSFATVHILNPRWSDLARQFEPREAPDAPRPFAHARRRRQRNRWI